MSSYTRGFTLLELLISLAIFSTVMMSALPSFSSYLERQRQHSIIDQVSHSWRSVRTQAVYKNSNITLCGSNDGIHCQRDWSEFLLTFTDDNHNNQAEPNEILQILPIRRFTPLSRRLS